MLATVQEYTSHEDMNIVGGGGGVLTKVAFHDSPGQFYIPARYCLYNAHNQNLCVNTVVGVLNHV